VRAVQYFASRNHTRAAAASIILPRNDLLEFRLAFHRHNLTGHAGAEEPFGSGAVLTLQAPLVVLPVISRRSFIRSAVGAAGLGAGLGAYTWLIEPHWLEIVRRPLRIARLPERLSGATLVQLSDIHVGDRVSHAYVLDTFHRVSALRPDIVAYTGDFVSYRDGIVEDAARIYNRAPQGRLATVGILGNHDYGPGWRHPEVAAGLVKMLEAYGIQVLRNQLLDVKGLEILGMDDLWATDVQPARVLAALAPRGAALVLSHNPDSVDLPGWDAYQGWILSGHTHGGQCKPPFLPPPILPVRNARYTAGAFELSGGRSLYISRGVGHLTQVRFNVRPEVTVFDLQAA
jgi:predicted MPP superfamily phosphohydrolase